MKGANGSSVPSSRRRSKSSISVARLAGARNQIRFGCRGNGLPNMQPRELIHEICDGLTGVFCAKILTRKVSCAPPKHGLAAKPRMMSGRQEFPLKIGDRSRLRVGTER